MAGTTINAMNECGRNTETQAEVFTLTVDEQELILQLQQDILESVVLEEDTSGILNRICLLAEQLLPNAVASLMVLDDASEFLNVHTAPNIPHEGVVRLNGLKPGSGSGSCGNAVYRGEPQYVRSTFMDPRWSDLRQFAYDFNLCSCWSMPIFSRQGKAIGSFALSSFEHRSPSDFHRKILGICSSIIGIVLERKKSQEAQKLFGMAFSGINQGIMITDANKRIQSVNQAFTHVLGYTLEEIVGKTPKVLASGRQGPDFYKNMWAHIKDHGHWRGEIWNRRKNGEIFPEWLSISEVRNDVGELTHYIGVLSDASEHYEAQNKLDNEFNFRQMIIESIPASFFLIDESRKPLLVNNHLLETVKSSKEEVQNSPMLDFIHEEDQEKALAVARQVHEGEKASFEARIMTEDGEAIPHLFNATKIVVDNRSCLLGVALNISKNKKIEASLAQELEKNEFMFRHVTDGVHILDENGYILDASDSFCEMLGYTRHEIIGMNITQCDVAIPAEDLLNAITHRLMESGRYQLETRHRRRDGGLIEVEISGACIIQGGRRLLFNSARDITERKRNEARTVYLAYHDQLTGLPNRPLLIDRFRQTFAEAVRSHRFGVVMFLDMDRFKQINDVHGHEIGDQVLRKISQRLCDCVRQGDTVARFGGDEFVILLSELASDQDAAANLAHLVGKKILAVHEEPIRIGDHDFFTSASIGISIFPHHGETVDDLIKEADIAMYRAKDSGRNALVFFEHDMQAVIAERYALEGYLRNAVRQNHLCLYLQSQVCQSGEIVGAEVLVRLNHPTRGLLLPGEFIPLAEETGIIISIGEWVLYEACKLIARLGESGFNLRIAVNVSPRQFRQANFVSRVKEILSETRANPACLTIEITENLLVESAAEVAYSMQCLSDLGIRFSIDDFGTGYSSLSYLKRLPLDELKIDKGFVQEVPNDVNDVALVESILSMAQHFGYSVVAEGVEKADQFEFLSKYRCDYFQGYLFERPVPVDAWLKVLAL